MRLAPLYINDEAFCPLYLYLCYLCHLWEASLSDEQYDDL